MRKILFMVVVMKIIMVVFTGCGIKNEVSTDELIKLEKQIKDKVLSLDSYDNFISCIIDEEKRIVVVELMDNSEEQQRWFKENINNSNNIIFKQGSSYILSIDVNQKIENIINNGPQLSSNPFDYIQVSQNEYDELLKYPKETFEYAIKDLIDTNASGGLRSYIEALLCSEINNHFKYDFESASDYLNNYKIFLNQDNTDFNDYDIYAKSLLK